MKLRIDKRRLRQLEQAAERVPGPRARLLVVDDEEENLFSLVRLLERRYEVRASTDPLQALQMLRQAPVDVVLTDQRMPQMLGTELLAEIKRIDDDNVRMILTGYIDAKDLITCINEGLVHHYLLKPWRIAELEAVIEEGLRRINRERAVRRLIPHQAIDRLYGGRLAEVQAGEGRRLSCAVIFLELRGLPVGFDQVPPREVFGLLTRYMGRIGPLIGRHHGYVDRYLGDGVLAIFDREGLAGADALACAQGLIRETERYNEEEAESTGWPLQVGVGIASGEVMLGTVGFPGRLEITALGTVVRTAVRIQELTQKFQCDILADAGVVEGVAVPSRALGDVAVRGSPQPMELHVVYAR